MAIHSESSPSYQNKFTEQAYSFEDVLIRPEVSDCTSRYGDDIDLSTSVAKGLPKINFPVLSANMDTITESQMAIEMAKNGGLGVIHRGLTIKDQVAEVKKVKSEMTIQETNPPSVTESATIAEAEIASQQANRGFVIIKPTNGKPGEFIGFASKRDFMKADHSTDLITTVMTQKDRLITVPEGTTLDQAVTIMRKKGIEKIPIVSPEGRLIGIYSLKDDEMLKRFTNASKNPLNGTLLAAAAIGAKPNEIEKDIERAHRLVEAGVDLLVIDIAHGGLAIVPQLLHRLKVQENIKVPIMAGNVATAETALRLVDSGADSVKVGIGPGAVCDTREVTGVGVPQLTAILWVVDALAHQTEHIPVIADGSITGSDDLAKALVAGADAGMIGGLFAGTNETPGEIIVDEKNQRVKVYRGMASKAARQQLEKSEGNTHAKSRVSEGSVKTVPAKGPVTDVLAKLNGIRSTMTYIGARTIPEMAQKGRFIPITASGATEQHRLLK